MFWSLLRGSLQFVAMSFPCHTHFLFNDNVLVVGTRKHHCYMVAYLGVMLIRTMQSFQRIRYQLESADVRPFM